MQGLFREHKDSQRKNKVFQMPNIRNKKAPERTFDGKKFTLYMTVRSKVKANEIKTALNGYGVKNHIVKLKNGYAVYVR